MRRVSGGGMVHGHCLCVTVRIEDHLGGRQRRHRAREGRDVAALLHRRLVAVDGLGGGHGAGARDDRVD